ncbi:Protein of unknown function [Paenibacillus sp. UNC496MF]|uniref:DUF2500 domain-containing protein n=1 Tax=Paenibacillus sp. UNC496MF TaxID=1502753 RepID=UPI0008E77823|nr:DUF2500 domain-containing protein [Paenibacillus sp. UNC496MF]SFJ57487.1 Protein of unknown function [Paenibacillus sp. UNC496MF]
MSDFPNDPGFFGFLKEMPLFFKLFGGGLLTVVIGGFLYVLIRGLLTWTTNNAAEVTTRPVTVADKRTQVWGGSGDSSSTTDYFATFEFSDGSRLELQVRGQQFGLLAAGDHGRLTYQGTRFKAFHRQEQRAVKW